MTGCFLAQGLSDSIAWGLRTSIDEDAGGVPILEALREYTARLDEALGKGAFRRFPWVDMQVLAAD